MENAMFCRNVARFNSVHVDMHNNWCIIILTFSSRRWCYLCTMWHRLPKPISFINVTDENYKVETITKLYEVTMRLVVRSVRTQDFGSFRCVATNSLGQTDGKIKIYSEYNTLQVHLWIIISRLWNSELALFYSRITVSVEYRCVYGLGIIFNHVNDLGYDFYANSC